MHDCHKTNSELIIQPPAASLYNEVDWLKFFTQLIIL